MTEERSPVLVKLEEIEARYVELEQQLMQPEIATNPTKLTSLTKEQGKLRKLVTDWREYKNIEEGLAGAEQMLADPDCEDELKEMAELEKSELEQKRDALFEKLRDSLVMADDMDIDAIIMEIRAGTGGDEAALFARDLYNMYVKYAESQRWKVEEMDFSASEMGGLKEAVLGIKGEGVWSQLQYEGGGHRVQRVPETESQGRVHTSAATVAVLPEPEEIDVQINPDDVVEHVSRSGGPGGQNVNKVSSAIKLEHLPTGITVSMRDEKSQHKNRAKAWRILRSRVYEMHASKERAERDSQRKSMIGSGDRSQKIRTYNFPQNRFTDHRINLSLYSLDKILAGDLAEVVDAMQKHDLEERVKNL